MKKSLAHICKHTLLALALTAPLGAAAASGTAVVVMTSDGSTHTVLLSEVSRIDFGSDKLTVTTVGGDATDFDYPSIDRILVGAESTGIKQITSEGNIAIWPAVTSSTLNIAGASADETVRVYAISGTLATTGVTDSEGALTLDLDNVPAGVYVVSVGTKSVKIIKK